MTSQIKIENGLVDIILKPENRFEEAIIEDYQKGNFSVTETIITHNTNTWKQANGHKIQIKLSNKK